MFYNIERTLQILPGVCWAVLGIVLLLLEIKNFKEMVIERPEAGRGGFIPPSEMAMNILLIPPESYMYFKEQK